MYQWFEGQIYSIPYYHLTPNLAKAIVMIVEYRRTHCLSYTLHKQSRERSEERQNLIGEIYIVKSLNAHMIGPGQCTVI